MRTVKGYCDFSERSDAFKKGNYRQVILHLVVHVMACRQHTEANTEHFFKGLLLEIASFHKNNVHKLAFYCHLLNITRSKFPELQNKVLTWLIYSLRLIVFM